MTRASSVLFWFGLVIIVSLALYRTSDRVHELETKLHETNAAIEAEQQSIHVLKAEWVYLANPARVERVAHKFLALRPTSPQQVSNMASLAEILPTRKEAMASVDVKGTPIANIDSKLQNLQPAPAPHPVTVASAATVAKHKTVAKLPVTTLASADSVHINDRMIMQHTTSTPRHDSIGTLLAELSDTQ